MEKYRLQIDRAAILSDLHIGLPYFRREDFVSLVEGLDRDTALILNGDVLDDPRQQLSREDRAVVDLIREQAERRPVFWLYGNHDENIWLPDGGNIVFARHLELGRQLLVLHGDDFDGVMPRSLLFIRVFKLLHRLRQAFGARPVHAAELAKRWAPFLYRVLTEEVKKNAVDCAKFQGFEAITCGHVHYAEESWVEGVRYFNTGSWTEEPLHFLDYSLERLALLQV